MEQSGTRANPRLDLGAAFMEFIVQPGMFIGTRALPIFKTSQKAAYFPAITRESITRTPDAKRATKGNYNRVVFETEDKSYACKEHGLEGPLGDDERALYKNDFDAELAVTKGVGSTLQLVQEVRIKDALFNTSTFTGSALYTDVSSSAPFDTAASDAIGSVKAAVKKVLQNCGLKAGTMVIGYEQFENLKLNTAIKAAIQYTQPLTDEQLARMIAPVLGLDQIIVGKAVYNGAKKGQTYSGSFVWPDDYALIMVNPPADGQDLSVPALGRTFLWDADSPENVTVEEYRDEAVRCDIYRVRASTDEKVIDAYFGHLLKID